MDSEWRVEIKLSDEGHGLSIAERLRTLDLDDDARAKLGDRVVVTRDGPLMFLYARSVAEARAAEQLVRKLVAEEGIDASTSLTRWDADAEAWVGPGGEPEEGAAAESEAAGEAEWEARIVFGSVRKAFE